MFGSARSGASAYANVGVETGVASASPHKLVVMLFDGAMVAVSSALHQMQAGDIPNKGKSISKAISIIENGLRASLDKKVGGEIALNLDALYEYMANRLVIANLKNQPQALEEVHQLLKGLKDAWESITPAPAATQQTQAAPQPAAYDPLAPQTSRFVKA
ncbi:flagellar export chaperone FliS [Noviherbaspirillum sp. Root189]|uniref:flagellar export chaperone FliS n=1 Tax=Noviherbaspirillum sp. Root189 TaxID=1736487 RepID=UPI000710EB23|nr:flagellar export chaperone FliS [Noviherbaspirillum sp. Root189]KRB93313.1 flagellar export chaperone FliS [Noviherbaspirillum sp. Root189]